MCQNLKEMMARENVTIEELSRTLRIHRNSVANKINGDTAFTVEEAREVWRIHFKRYDYEWLFYREPAQNGA